MNTKQIILIIVVILIILVGGYFAMDYSPAKNTNPAPVQQVNSGATVSIKNFTFDPTSLTVKAGATVTWTNNDSAPHQIKSATFNSEVLGNGQTYSFTFSTAGQYDYLCAIHPSMIGKIIVE